MSGTKRMKSSVRKIMRPDPKRFYANAFEDRTEQLTASWDELCQCEQDETEYSQSAAEERAKALSMELEEFLYESGIPLESSEFEDSNCYNTNCQRTCIRNDLFNNNIKNQLRNNN